ncbi:hypothetical protein MRX96_051434, partial [Rhipicephalus microplus]
MTSSAHGDDRAGHAAGGRRRAKQKKTIGGLSPTAVQHPEVARASQDVQGLQGQQVRHVQRPGTGSSAGQQQQQVPLRKARRSQERRLPGVAESLGGNASRPWASGSINRMKYITFAVILFVISGFVKS